RSVIVALRSGQLRRWDLTLQKMTWEAHSRSEGDRSYPIYSVAIAHDGSRVALGRWDGVVHIWDAQAGRLLPRYAGSGYYACEVSWSPDGRRLASLESIAQRNAIHVWNADSGALVFTSGHHNGKPQRLRWSPDGQHLASGDNSGAVALWDATTGVRLAR